MEETWEREVILDAGVPNKFPIEHNEMSELSYVIEKENAPSQAQLTHSHEK